MTQIHINITGAAATAVKVGPITAGMVGVPVTFTFSAEWDGLNIIPVFAAGSVKKDNYLKENKSVVPHEVLREGGQILMIGAEGRNQAGDLVIPTTWARVGEILRSASAAEDPSLAPTPSQFDRFMAEVTGVDDKIEQALQQAKDSGQFKGDPGQPGPKGDKGDRGDPGPAGSGASSWNDLTDKPFGVVGGKNTITWAGNPGSFQRAEIDQWVKVSDAVVTDADIRQGANISWFSELQYAASEEWNSPLPISHDGDIIEVWVTEMLNGNMFPVVQFRPNGVYFKKIAGVEGDTYPVSVTLPGFGKFPVAKPIESQYLPDALRFGNVPGSNTWVKEADFIGSVTDAAKWGFFKISDAVFTREDLSLGFTMHYRNWEGLNVYNNYENGVSQTEDGILDVPFVDENGNATYGVRCYPEGLGHDPGIYVYYWSDEDCVERFTINGFGKFTVSQKLNPRYLPEGHNFGVIGEGDKLEWDQDLCTPKTIIACASGGASTFFKVSDQVITAEDLANGAYSHLYTAFNEETSDIYCSFENGYIQQMEDGAVWIKAEDTWGNHMSGYEIFCYPENAAYPPGIYFGAYQWNMSQFEDRVVGLTIPGYGKFQKKKTLEMDYLPKQLRMGEAQGFDNTLTWDGNTAKLEQHPSEPGWFILSPVHVKWEDLQNGFYLEAPAYGSLLVDYFEPENFPYGGCHSIDNTNPDDITIKHIDENGNEWPFIRFTPDGVLVYFSSDCYTDYYFGLEHYYGVRLHTLTIPGFAGFENAEVNNTINPKYLPKARTVGKCMGDTVTPWEFNELVNALKEAGYIAM